MGVPPPARRRWIWAVASGLLAVAVLAALWVGRGLLDHPSLAPFAAWRLPAAEAPARAGTQVRVTFLGVSTLLVDDGETALLTDGFFTRPGKLATLLGRIAPDPAAIRRGLDAAGIHRLAAIFVVHSHYDHALDAPLVALQTGAVLVGSSSTANIARGLDFPDERFRLVHASEPMHFGRFTVTMIPSRHFPHGVAMGEIEAPLRPPDRASAWQEGGSYSELIEHPLGTLLVQGSAGWRDGALDGRRADVVALGIGALGTSDAAYLDGYYRAVIEAVRPRCVIPIHYDDYTLPLDGDLEPMPSMLDDVPATLRALEQRARAAPGIGMGLLPPLAPVVLFGEGAVACGPSPVRS